MSESGMFMSEILLIVVVILSMCVTCLATILILKKTNEKKSRAPIQSEPKTPIVRNDIREQSINVNAEQPRQNRDIYESGKSETFSMGIGGDKVQRLFDRDVSSEEEKTAMILGGDLPPRQYNASESVTVQYHKDGVPRSFQLTQSYALIGRESDCDIIVSTSSHISRHHAIIFIKNGGVYISDLRSKGGTYVNDSPIKGAVRLNGSERIKISSSEITVILH